LTILLLLFALAVCDLSVGSSTQISLPCAPSPPHVQVTIGPFRGPKGAAGKPGSFAAPGSPAALYSIGTGGASGSNRPSADGAIGTAVAPDSPQGRTASYHAPSPAILYPPALMNTPAMPVPASLYPTVWGHPSDAATMVGGAGPSSGGGAPSAPPLPLNEASEALLGDSPVLPLPPAGGSGLFGGSKGAGGGGGAPLPGKGC
jgi:hypothetical protein